MKKILFVSVLVLVMTMLCVSAFAAEDAPAAAEDKIIEHEAQGEVMPISEEIGEIAIDENPAAESGDAKEEAAEEVKEEAAEDEETEEAEKVEIDAEKMAKNLLIINGEKLEIAEDMGAIVAKDGVIYLPVRVVLEKAGYQVSWAEKEQMVMGANQTTGAMFIMQLDNPLLFYLNESKEEGKTVMEATPFKNEEEWRTYVPLGGIAQALGMKVGFDAEVSAITLGK